MSPSRYPVQIWNTLEKLRSAATLSHFAMAERLGLGEFEYFQMRKEKIEPSVIATNHVLEDFDLDFDRFVDGQIDFSMIAAHAAGDRKYLPEHYSSHAFSKKRNATSIINYMDLFGGGREKTNLMLRHFQLSRMAFDNPDETINVRLVMDFLDFLVRKGWSQSAFYEMGRFRSNLKSHDRLREELGDCSTPQAAYEKILNHLLQHLDLNWTYTIDELHADHCIASARPTEATMATLHSKKPGSAQACAYRGGTFSSFLGLLDLPPATVRETACMHQGASACRYLIQYKTHSC